MKKAVDLRPDDSDWRILLAQLEVEARLYGQALATLAPIHSLEPSQAFNFYTVSAYCHASLKDLPGARAFIEKAAPYAKTAQQKQQVEQFTSYLGSAQAPGITTEDSPMRKSRDISGVGGVHASLPRVHGLTKTFQCGQRTFRLHLQVGTREMIFAIDDPKDVVVRNVTELQWTCGPLKPREVTVVYQPQSGVNVDGKVVELVFDISK
jgi:hypothetical protein